MNTNKIIILNTLIENKLYFDEFAYREYLQHLIDIKKWENEMINDIKNVVKKYETPGDISLLAA